MKKDPKLMECVKVLFHGVKVWQVSLNPSAGWLEQRVLRYDPESFSRLQALKNARSYL